MLQMIRGVYKCNLSRNSSHVLMLPLYSTIITQILVSQTRKLVHITQLKIQNHHFSLDRFSLFCTVNSKYRVFIFSTYPKPFIKCYKPRNRVKFFSRTCLSKTMIISDMIRLYQGHILLRDNHVSTKQRLAVIFASFFQYFVVCRKYYPWVIEFQENQLTTNLHNKTLYNNVNFISLGKIFDTEDTFGILLRVK